MEHLEDTLRLEANDPAQTEMGLLSAKRELSMVAKRIHSVSNNDFVDLDPCLKHLKTGNLMQRTLFNTKMAETPPDRNYPGTITSLSAKYSRLKRNTDKAGAFNTLEPTHRLATSDLHAASTEAASMTNSVSRAPKIPHGTRFLKYKDGTGPNSNYANVELFRIPDKLQVGDKQRNQKQTRLSQIDDYKNYTVQLTESVYEADGGATYRANILGTSSENPSIFKANETEEQEPE